jgi:hypothetical protein
VIIDHRNHEQTAALASQYMELQKSGMAPHPQSPAGAALLKAYRSWQVHQENQQTSSAVQAVSIAVKLTRNEAEQARKKQAKKAAKQLKKARKAMALAGPGLEERAIRRSKKRIVSARKSGATAASALAAGFECYRLEGGKLTEAQWKRRPPV